MEAGAVPRREADIAPAPAAADPLERAGGWSPADPFPVGAGGFALTTFVLSMANSHLVKPSSLVAALGVALVYGGLVQLLAGMWEFRTGNTFGAVVFSSFGAFWISFYILVHVTPAALLLPHAVSVYLYAWTIWTLILLIASLRTTGVVVIIFLLLFVALLLLSIGWANLPSSSGTTWIKWGGYVGLATAVMAWYAAFAAVVNSTFGRVIAPVFPLNV